MPNLKMYVDRKTYAAVEANCLELLPQLRDLLTKHLNVPVAACQIAVIEVLGMADQPTVNAEVSILPAKDRDRELLTFLCESIQRQIHDATRVSVAVRCAQLDPATYVAIKP